MTIVPNGNDKRLATITLSPEGFNLYQDLESKLESLKDVAVEEFGQFSYTYMAKVASHLENLKKKTVLEYNEAAIERIRQVGVQFELDNLEGDPCVITMIDRLGWAAECEMGLEVESVVKESF